MVKSDWDVWEKAKFRLSDGDKAFGLFRSRDGKRLYCLTNLMRLYEVVVKKGQPTVIIRIY